MKTGEGKLFLVTLGKYCLTLSQAWKENLATHGRGRTFAPTRLQAALFFLDSATNATSFNSLYQGISITANVLAPRARLAHLSHWGL